MICDMIIRAKTDSKFIIWNPDTNPWQISYRYDDIINLYS